MKPRGKLLLFAVLFILWGSPSRALEVRYTAPPAMSGLNSQIAGAPSRLGRSGIGAFHLLVERIFEGSNADLRYIPSESYNMAVQNVMLYGAASPPNNNIDFIIGITFDEDNLRHIEYVPVSIYEDFLAIAIDTRSLAPGFVPDRSLDATMLSLMRTARPAALLKLRLDVADSAGAARFEHMEGAFEAVFTLRQFLIAPQSFVENYLALGSSNPRVRSLQIFQSQRRTVKYFIAYAKAADARMVSFDGRLQPLGSFIMSRLSELEASGELGVILGVK